MLNEEILESIKNSTNEYAAFQISQMSQLNQRSKFKKWVNIDLQEMRKFIAMIIVMALNRKPSIDDYYSENPLFFQPIIKELFTKDR